MIDEIKMVYKGNHYLILMIIALFIGLLFCKKNRKLFFIPAIIFSIIILNPIIYSFWSNHSDYGYWRLLWMLPVVPACAMVPAFVIERVQKTWIKIVTVGLAIAVFILCGFFMLNYKYSSFDIAANADKLPDSVVKTGEALLELDDEPYAVTDGAISIYLRQYSGKIRSPYSRDVNFGTPSAEARPLINNLPNGDMNIVAGKMLNLGYEYVVTRNDEESKKQALEDAGFVFLRQINKYGIYRVTTGNRTEVRTYNDLHQVTSITYVDSDGNAVNGEDGYATILYDYDSLGQKNYEFHLDAEGNAYADENGVAGYKWENDLIGRRISQTYLGIDGNPIVNDYATKKTEYKYGSRIAKESYYDAEGNPINIGEIGYTRYENKHSVSGDLLLSYFYNKEGDLLEAGSYNLHKYLQSLMNRELIIFISVKDEASSSLTKEIINDLHALGIKTDLTGKLRSSFYAVITPEKTIENVSEEALSFDGEIGDLSYSIRSAGYTVGNLSSIIINGKEFSPNARGLNIVVVENGEVIDSVAFDTYLKEMYVTR